MYNVLFNKCYLLPIDKKDKKKLFDITFYFHYLLKNYSKGSLLYIIIKYHFPLIRLK